VEHNLPNGNQASDFVRFVGLFRMGGSLFNFPFSVSDDLASGDLRPLFHGTVEHNLPNGNQASDFVRFVGLFRMGGSLFNFPFSVSDDLASGDLRSPFHCRNCSICR